LTPRIPIPNKFRAISQKGFIPAVAALHNFLYRHCNTILLLINALELESLKFAGIALISTINKK